MDKQFVKITSKGKVRMLISGSMKYQFKNLLELFLNDTPKAPFNLKNAPRLTAIALVNEIYCKYHTQLCLLNGDATLLLTLPQAYAFWCLCQQYDQHAYADAGMGGVLMQLHQKLS